MFETPDAQTPASLPTARVAVTPTELTYAPPAKSGNRPILVLLFGVTTSLVALAAVYVIDRATKSSLMGWYIDYFLPVGALAVGLVASSGYGISSWYLGVKIRRALLWTMMGLLVACYFTAEYVEFRIHRPVIVVSRAALGERQAGKTDGDSSRGFLGILSLYGRQLDLGQRQHAPQRKTRAAGHVGYFFRLGGVLGFVLGGAIVPGVLMKKDYCELCERYMKTRSLAVVGASVPFKKFSKKDTEGIAQYNQRQQEALQAAHAHYERMLAAAHAGDVSGFRSDISRNKAQKKAAEKLPRRLYIAMIRCPGCSNGYLQVVMKSGQGNQVKSEVVAKKPLSPDFVRALDAATG